MNESWSFSGRHHHVSVKGMNTFREVESFFLYQMSSQPTYLDPNIVIRPYGSVNTYQLNTHLYYFTSTTHSNKYKIHTIIFETKNLTPIIPYNLTKGPRLGNLAPPHLARSTVTIRHSKRINMAGKGWVPPCSHLIGF